MNSNDGAAQPAAGPGGSQQSLNITVHLPPPEQNLSFRDVDSSTNVGQLKLLIQNALPHRPVVSRVRVIYRGRFANDFENLTDLIGIDAIRNSSDHNLHAVIRPSPSEDSSSASVRSVGSASNPFRTPSIQTASSGLSTSSSTNPFRAPTISRPQSQPQTPPAVAPQANQTAQRQAFQPPFPPLHDINNIINHQIHAAQIHAAQHATHQAHLLQQSLYNSHNNNSLSSSTQPLSSNSSEPVDNGENGQHTTRSSNVFQETIARQQQQRAAAGLHGIGSPEPDASNLNGPQSQNLNAQENSSAPNGSNRIHEEGVGPNGTRWSVTIDRTGPVHITQSSSGRGPISQLPFGPQGFESQPLAPWNLNTPGQPSDHTGAIRDSTRDQSMNEMRSYVSSLREETDNLLTMLDIDTTGEHNIPNMSSSHNVQILHRQAERIARITSQINSRLIDVDSNRQQRQSSPLETNNQSQTRQRPQNAIPASADNPSSEDNGTGSGLATGQLDQASMNAQSSQVVTPSASSGATLPDIFLLTGPEGSYGLVTSGEISQATSAMARSNHSAFLERLHYQYMANRQALADLGLQMYTRNRMSSLIPPGMASSAQASSHELGSRQRYRSHRHRHHRHERAQQPGREAEAQDNGRQRDQGQVAQQARQPANAQADDRLAALAGHLWLVFRVLVFLYFIAGGGGWRRPILIAILSAAVYLAQIGIFRGVTDRVRQFFESLLPLPEERRREQARNEARANETEPQQGEQGQGEPNPEDTARRLLREQNMRFPLWLQDQAMIVMRAVALFVASLWPSLGERMAAAREERLRQNEEQQRQEEQTEGQTEEQTEEQNEDQPVQGGGEQVDAGAGSQQPAESEKKSEGSIANTGQVAQNEAEPTKEKLENYQENTSDQKQNTQPEQERSETATLNEPSWSFSQDSAEASGSRA